MVKCDQTETTYFIFCLWETKEIVFCPSEMLKEAGAFEAPRQSKEELCANDTSRHPKVFKLGQEHGCQ